MLAAVPTLRHYRRGEVHRSPWWLTTSDGFRPLSRDQSDGAASSAHADPLRGTVAT